MLRFGLLGIAVLLIAAGCGGSSQKTYTTEATRSCLTKDGAKIGGPLDFVASTAIGGAFVVHMPGQPSDGNWATIAFGDGDAGAIQLQLAYERFAFPNVKANLSDVLKRYNNAVTLWHEHPASGDLSLVVNCLK